MSVSVTHCPSIFLVREVFISLDFYLSHLCFAALLRNKYDTRMTAPMKATAKFDPAARRGDLAIDGEG